MANTIITEFQTNVSQAGAAVFGILSNSDGQIEVFGAGSVDADQVEDVARRLILMASRIRNAVRELQSAAH